MKNPIPFGLGDIVLPVDVQNIISKLQNSGYDSYVFGSCVRDSLRGMEPHDWDICTDAPLMEIYRIFGEYKIVTSRLCDKTTDIYIDGVPHNITTFCGTRSDTNYHPQTGTKADRWLQEYLAKQDFAVNAMAYNKEVGLVDYFGGVDDLWNHVLRCVGNPDAKLSENALCILRAMRLSAVYGFHIAEDTATAMHQHKSALARVAPEKIRDELCKLLLGHGELDVLLEYQDVIATIIPELKPCIEFGQNNRYREYTIYSHSVNAVHNYRGNDLSVKLALLLHDIGKPLCYTEDEKGGHFFGHPQISRDLAENILGRLHFDTRTKTEVLELVLHHDDDIAPSPKTVRRWLNKIGKKRFSQLLSVKEADILAHIHGRQESRIERFELLCEVSRSILDEQ